MDLTYVLAGNPNSGKTTLFNSLTGNHQYVGNWPGVTVEKKMGTLKKDGSIHIVDLPGIYSLSPYSNEEIVARDYLLSEDANVIINIVDATNLERNLYLTTQLLEFGTPMVIALNQMDVVRKRGMSIDGEAIEKAFGVRVVEISALEEEGVEGLVRVARDEAARNMPPTPMVFPEEMESLIKHLQEGMPETVKPNLRRFHALKFLEHDSCVIKELGELEDIEDHERAVEARFGDCADAVIANERYRAIELLLQGSSDEAEKRALATERIDRVLLNRVLALPIFIAIIVALYYVVVSTVGSYATGWANEGVFGDGWYLDPIALVDPSAGAQGRYDEASEPYDEAQEAAAVFLEAAKEEGVSEELVDIVAANFLAEPSEGMLYALDGGDPDPNSGEAQSALRAFEQIVSNASLVAETTVVDTEETFETTFYIYYGEKAQAIAEAEAERKNERIADEGREGAAEAVAYDFDGWVYDEKSKEEVPQGLAVPAPEAPEAYGVWIPGIPALVGSALQAVNCAAWLYDLIMDGVIAGVGAVLGFVPQIMILFFLLAFLEGCGYMARVTFILDRIFRRFGLSGKTFIPMIVGTGCGVPGIMASRTIESESSRHLTVMTTTFMPCSAKLPIIALISTAVFGGVWWVAPVAYFMGIASIVISGIILKKTKPFMGETTPYIMELPEYRLPRLTDMLRSMGQRAWSFIKKAGTIILAAAIIVWFLSGYGFYEGRFQWVGEELMGYSLLAHFGNSFAWLFAPLGFNNWQSAATVITGLAAKENVVSTMAVLFGGASETWSAEFLQSLALTTGSSALVPVAAFSFMAFQLLCCPCFAAMGAIKREMGGFNRWFWAAIGWECVWAYVAALLIFQLGSLFTIGAFGPWTIVAIAVLALMLWGLFRKPPKREESVAKPSNSPLGRGVSETVQLFAQCGGSCGSCHRCSVIPWTVSKGKEACSGKDIHVARGLP